MRQLKEAATWLWNPTGNHNAREVGAGVQVGFGMMWGGHGFYRKRQRKSERPRERRGASSGSSFSVSRSPDSPDYTTRGLLLTQQLWLSRNLSLILPPEKSGQYSSRVFLLLPSMIGFHIRTFLPQRIDSEENWEWFRVSAYHHHGLRHLCDLISPSVTPTHYYLWIAVTPSMCPVRDSLQNTLVGCAPWRSALWGLLCPLLNS